MWYFLSSWLGRTHCAAPKFIITEKNRLLLQRYSWAFTRRKAVLHQGKPKCICWWCSDSKCRALLCCFHRDQLINSKWEHTSIVNTGQMFSQHWECIPDDIWEVILSVIILFSQNYFLAQFPCSFTETTPLSIFYLAIIHNICIVTLTVPVDTPELFSLFHKRFTGTSLQWNSHPSCSMLFFTHISGN